MIACCSECGAPLTLADLGYACCLTCHWQHIFEYGETSDQAGQLRLTLYGGPGSDPRAARDREHRIWQRVRGDGQVWCVVCGGSTAGARLTLFYRYRR